MWTVYSAVDNQVIKNVGSSYGDFCGSYAGVLPSSCPHRKEKIFSGLRDKQEIHSPYYNY